MGTNMTRISAIGGHGGQWQAQSLPKSRTPYPKPTTHPAPQKISDQQGNQVNQRSSSTLNLMAHQYFTCFENPVWGEPTKEESHLEMVCRRFTPSSSLDHLEHQNHNVGQDSTLTCSCPPPPPVAQREPQTIFQAPIDQMSCQQNHPHTTLEQEAPTK